MSTETTLDLVEETELNDSPAELRKPELLEEVVSASEVAKRHAKPVVEETLASLGKALAEGRNVILPGLGKVMITRSKETDSARILNVKIRQPLPKDGVAEDSDNS